MLHHSGLLTAPSFASLAQLKGSALTVALMCHLVESSSSQDSALLPPADAAGTRGIQNQLRLSYSRVSFKCHLSIFQA